MGMGIVNDEEFFRELNSLSSDDKKTNWSDAVSRIPSHQSPSIPDPVITPDIVTTDLPGRKEGDVNVPDSLRQIIGETSVLEGRQAAIGLAGLFGISPSSVSAYAKGATSTASYDTPKPSIISHINKSRRRASKKASQVLSRALDAISQDKLDYTDAKDLSAIAKDMSVIIKNLEPPPDVVPSDPSSKGPQFVIFAPQFRPIESFGEVIRVNE